MAIKDRIKEIRTSIGIIQVKFAERIAISTSYISEIENGVKKVNERAIRLITAEYNVNETWLRTGQGAMFKDDASASLSEAIQMFKSLSPDFQSIALKMLSVLTEMNSKVKLLNWKMKHMGIRNTTNAILNVYILAHLSCLFASCFISPKASNLGKTRRAVDTQDKEV